MILQNSIAHTGMSVPSHQHQIYERYSVAMYYFYRLAILQSYLLVSLTPMVMLQRIIITLTLCLDTPSLYHNAVNYSLFWNFAASVFFAPLFIQSILAQRHCRLQSWFMPCFVLNTRWQFIGQCNSNGLTVFWPFNYLIDILRQRQYHATSQSIPSRHRNYYLQLQIFIKHVSQRQYLTHLSATTKQNCQFSPFSSHYTAILINTEVS
jgi:hypothetical protein